MFMEFCGYKDTTERVRVEAQIAIRSANRRPETPTRTGRTISHQAPSKTVHLPSVFTLSSRLWLQPLPEIDVLTS